MFEFNETLDRTVIKPVAEFYRDVVPEVLQWGFRNFVGNIRDVATAIHHLVQGKPADAAESAARVVFNTTIGFLGISDPASEMGYAKTREDFGQTFGRWEVGTGPYVVLPLFGPSTVRDTFGLILDFRIDPMTGAVSDSGTRSAVYGVAAIDLRKDLLDAQSTIEALSFDKYSGVRDAWMARRRSQVYDGDPPPLPMKDE
jgi:phospholipid-binding lipoprotein MlaA